MEVGFMGMEVHGHGADEHHVTNCFHEHDHYKKDQTGGMKAKSAQGNSSTEQIVSERRLEDLLNGLRSVGMNMASRFGFGRPVGEKQDEQTDEKEVTQGKSAIVPTMSEREIAQAVTKHPVVGVNLADPAPTGRGEQGKSTNPSVKGIETKSSAFAKPSFDNGTNSYEDKRDLLEGFKGVVKRFAPKWLQKLFLKEKTDPAATPEKPGIREVGDVYMIAGYDQHGQYKEVDPNTANQDSDWDSRI